MPAYCASIDGKRRVMQTLVMPDTHLHVVTSSDWMLEISQADYETINGNPGQWRYVDGTLTAGWDMTDDMPHLRLDALIKVDNGAEKARLAYLTAGAGQALEYQASQAEAVAVAAAADPLDPTVYPWLLAEQSAQAAGGVTLTLRQTAAMVLAQANAWTETGAAIKQIRRTAKIAIAAATTPEEIASILEGIIWPTP